MGIQLPAVLQAWSSYDQLQIRIALFGRNVDINVVSASLALLFIFLISRIKLFLKGLNAVSYLPGLRVPFQPLALPGAALPTSWWNPGLRFPWEWRFTFYKQFGSENVSVVPFISGVPGIYTSNLDVGRQVISGGHKSSFIKPETASRALLLWGMNLVASEGDMWRKHRRIMGPAFTNKLYALVWTKTIDIYREMIKEEGWTNKDTVEVPIVQTLTFKLALLVLGSCGFGFPFSWSEPPVTADGTLSVQESLRIVADSHMFAISAPKWAWKLPFQRIKETRAAHEQLAEFMQSQVDERKKEIHEKQLRGKSGTSERRDNAFTMLVRANEMEEKGPGGKLKLDDSELIGNIFIMLFAGHETTAHTLAATLGFLALYQDIQDEVVQQIVEVVGWDKDPAYEDYSKLNKVLSAFYEALRMFPAGHVMIREAKEDTTLDIPNPVGQEGSTTIPIPKGVQVIVDMVGVQYNPRYFDEPEKYKPSRWYSTSTESETFTAFSVGPRACIGRKFAATEAIAFLTMLLRDWAVDPLLTVKKGTEEKETIEEWKNRVLEAKLVITLGVSDMPVRFTRRKRA